MSFAGETIDVEIKNAPVFTIKQVANWQLTSDVDKVELPDLQRGFVWKPSQVETLWDSLLRGYPIGAFFMSKNHENELFLMDGQQRAKAIALGSFDPWRIPESKNSAMGIISIGNAPTVWIDLDPFKCDITASQKFLIRVLTVSHPWGYQAKNHQEILSLRDRRKALSNFKLKPNYKEGYSKIASGDRFPYDSNLAVPLSFVIEAVAMGELEWQRHLVLLCRKFLPSYLKSKAAEGDSNDFIDRLLKSDFTQPPFLEIFNAVKQLDKLLIPGIIVEKEILLEEMDNSVDTGNEQLDNPTLFVRLNTEGTRISGDELIYSIYKASYPKCKLLVEEIGATFVTPALVLSLVSRLALSGIDLDNKYPSVLKIQDFQRQIKNEHFKVRLNILIGEIGNSPARKLFTRAFSILQSAVFGLPPILIKKLVIETPDLFLLLLTWLDKNEDFDNYSQAKSIVGSLTALSWFGGKDTTKFIKEIWPSAGNVDFWKISFVNINVNVKRQSILFPLIKPQLLRGYLIRKTTEVNNSNDYRSPGMEEVFAKYFVDLILEKNEKSESDLADNFRQSWNYFLYKLMNCKQMLLYAQRNYLIEKFHDFNQLDNLEDTSTPWDLDHIYPSEWVRRLGKIDGFTKQWNFTIGNLRALALEDNRSESNMFSPAGRLSDEGVRKVSFILPEDWELWQQLTDSVKVNDPKVFIHAHAIIHRLVNIYTEWFDMLDIGNQFKSDIVNEPGDILVEF